MKNKGTEVIKHLVTAVPLLQSIVHPFKFRLAALHPEATAHPIPVPAGRIHDLANLDDMEIFD